MLKKISFTLLAAVIIIMMAATFVEKQTGSATAIYGSWWFAAVWALLCVYAIIYCLRRKMQKRPAVFLLHLSFVVILLGALITHIWGLNGTIHLRLGQTSGMFEEEGSHNFKALPFTMQLNNFDLQCYPGTDSPMDYVSYITCHTQSDSTDLRISMNHIGELQSYRFYQAAYDPDGQGTYLAVSHDPIGIGVTYTGYGLLLVSMILLLVLPNEGFRRALKRLSLIAALVLLPFSQLFAAPKSLQKDEAHAFCSLYAYYNGRICPVQTIAKDFTTKLYGKSSYEGLNYEQVFTSWYFFPTQWVEEPMIKVKGDAAKIIGAKGKYVPYRQFFSNEDYKLQDALSQGNRSVLEAHEKATLLQMLLSGQLLKIYPYKATQHDISVADSIMKQDSASIYTRDLAKMPVDTSLVWLSQGDNLPMSMPEDEWFFVKKSLDYLGELAVMHNHDKFIETVGKIRKYQQKNAADVLPSDRLFQAEVLYNSANYTRPLAMGFATLGILLFLVFLFWNVPNWVIYACDVVLGLASGYLLWLMCLRGYISGHLPLSNGYETMQCMALVVLLLTLFLQRRLKLIIPFGFLLCGLTLLVSTFGQSNPQISHLMPVLQSPLLSIHVCIIMVSYSLLAFCFLCGIAALVSRKEGLVNQLTNISRTLLYPALFCMAAGIFIGAIWANVSWGRYWGWDPKEVWALITFLVYSFALHSESLPSFRKPRFYHLFMILAFLTVLMTYFGVNFLLGGMHSYANS